MTDWQTTSTAPKNTPLLVINRQFANLYSIEEWDGKKWRNDEGLSVGPTHWQPLPPPPK